MRRKKEKQFGKAAEMRAYFADEIESVTPPQSLAPQELDNIIKRGNNLKEDHRIEVRKERKKHRPIQLRVLAAVMSLLLVIGVGVVGLDRAQYTDLGYVLTTKETKEMDFTAAGLNSVAQAEKVAANDYTPIKEYLTALKKQAEENNRVTFFEAVAEGFETVYNSSKAADAAAPEAVMEESTTAEFSGTNNQVAEVQEGDIIKTDGRFLYVLSASGKLVCEQVKEDGSLVQTAAVSFDQPSGGYHEVQDMYLFEDTLAVVAQSYGGKKDQVTVLLYRVDAAGKLSLFGSYAQEGYYTTARLTDGVLYLVANQKNISIYSNFDNPEDYVPLVWNDGEERLVTTEEIYIAGCPDTVMRYTTVSGYRLGADIDTVQVTSVLGSGAAQVYCTKDTLYLFSNNSRYQQQMVGMQSVTETETVINRFALIDGKAVAMAQGSVVGRMLNQFSADEYDGMLRVTTTDEKACRVTVLDASLQKISELTGLAEGEDIYACKFMGETAYLVTFYQTDPLFVLDLSDIMKMKVVGELKIPGYSNYLYPIGENYLIGVGRNADENGSVDGMRVNLFDVSDPCEPKLADVKILYGNSSSLAGETHKAYYADAANGLVGFPVYRYADGREQFNGFVLFTVENGNLTVVKELDYLDEMNGLDWDTKQNGYYRYNQYHIQRGVYVADTIYLLADRCIYAYGRTDFAYLGRFDLD